MGLQNWEHITFSYAEGGLWGERETSSWPEAVKSTTTLFADDCLLYRTAVRIRVRIDYPHLHVCRKRRLNGSVPWMKPKKTRSRVTAEMWRSMADATPPGQMQCSRDHNKNSTTVQVYHPRTGIKQRELRKYLGLNIHKTLSWKYTSVKWLRRHTIPCHSQAETSVVGQ
jgi:hypothetical protein